MTIAIEEANQESALMILAECRVRVMHAIRMEEGRVQLDPERLADLQAVLAQLRDERRAIQRGDRAVIARARFLYGLLLKQVNVPVRA